ncbi:DUF960 domain-containing protein [Clostridium bowmanii]|uniref:DUF960 domain-containing protein n=1 Tax=Clostridium bowmanii TaxID=132925 RepID=UPI001C0AD99F|nr:DUF960 domain-containing protein [Clostridium bowmanii]MBU3190316.1 DUF960 domain-containing protein [Clostridium bowmanii]MCA1072472.1 DUF960 domain-containing protein [Clostridium bowmanii]
MFDKSNRYMTRGVEADIPLELQLFMWSNIDKLKEQGEILDYLQVFELTEKRANDIFYQNIEHRQEVPEYKKTYKLLSKETVNAKVFVIDDGDNHSTMMIASEY